MSGQIELPLSRSEKDALSIATRAARDAGTIQKECFYQDKRIENKGNRNLVTEVDLLSEKCILNIIRDEYPDHSILCEESGETENTSEFRWIIDPLDGTTNYAFGIPIFCVSIGLIHHDEVLLGVVYDPMRDELFQAQKGKGAWLNGTPISVSSERNIQTTLVGFDLGYDDARSKEMLSRANSLWNSEVAFRLIGSAALGMTYVACGRMDLYFHRRIYPWDIAAAILMVREAGGGVIRTNGEHASVWDTKIIACSDVNRQALLIETLQ